MKGRSTKELEGEGNTVSKARDLESEMARSCSSSERERGKHWAYERQLALAQILVLREALADIGP